MTWRNESKWCPCQNTIPSIFIINYLFCVNSFRVCCNM
ncbi:unnamed protein product [Larinioides sclopetarius]|uniref:Uncharacterized protein n=1 Tax=Larinioides sclopetarius TaxID=280406 RepID=A0AAV1YZH6_9ARAC